MINVCFHPVGHQSWAPPFRCVMDRSALDYQWVYGPSRPPPSHWTRPHSDATNGLAYHQPQLFINIKVVYAEVHFNQAYIVMHAITMVVDSQDWVTFLFK